MKVYVHKNCSSCKKALRWLSETGKAAEIYNLLEETPTVEELEEMVESYGGNLKKLFNTSGQLYRELNLKETVSTMTAEEAFTLLQENGMLVKRPFLLSETKNLVGFKPAEWDQL